jgi:hypothetical protein
MVLEDFSIMSSKNKKSWFKRYQPGDKESRIFLVLPLIVRIAMVIVLAILFIVLYLVFWN